MPAAQTPHHVPVPGTTGTPEAPTPAVENPPRPRLVPHHQARRSPDPATRLTARALSTVMALVPCRLALFWSVTRRMELAGAVVLEGGSGESASPIGAEFFARIRAVDPFAPSRGGRSDAALLTVADVGGAAGLANSAYARHLDRAGLQDQVALYLRAAGGLRGMIALYRARGERPFGAGELHALRKLHPLVEEGYACSLGSEAESSPLPPALTQREAEVATLIAHGASNAEIARALNVELTTVKTHLTQIYAKLGLRSRTQLALRLAREGLPTARAS